MTVIPVFAIVLFLILIFASASSRTPTDVELVSSLLPFAVWGLFLGLFGLYFLIGLIGVGFSLAGRDFRYPLIGNWLARYVGYSFSAETLGSEDGEDRFVAAVSHSTAIITLWGMVTPLIAWITQKDRSRFLRFQSLQALIYQGIGALGYFGGMAIYMFFFFGSMVFLFVSGGLDNSEMAPIAVLLFFLPFLCFAFLFFVLGPLYQLFAFIASIRTLRGHDYRYPILGKFLAKRVERETQVPAETVR